jgi:hypothetical protein
MGDGVIHVQSEFGHGSTFEFFISCDVVSTTPSSATNLERLPTLPPGVAALARVASAHTPNGDANMSHESSAAGAAPLMQWQSPQSTASPLSSPGFFSPPALSATNLHGLTAAECAQLAQLRILHVGLRPSQNRAWNRVCQHYGIHSDMCSNVDEARALLLQQSSAAVAAAMGGAFGSAPSLPTLLLADLDAGGGVTEELCVELCAAHAIRKLLFLYSRGHLPLHVDDAIDDAESMQSGGAAVAAAPAAAPSSSPPATEWSVVASSLDVPSLQLQLHPTVRRSLPKPFKTRALLRAILSLLSEPLSHSASASSDSQMSVSSGTSDDPSPGASPRRGMGSSLQSAPAGSLSANLVRQATTRTPKIANIAKQHPLRSDAHAKREGGHWALTADGVVALGLTLCAFCVAVYFVRAVC